MRFLLILGAVALSIHAARAQTFEGTDSNVGSQWKANDSNLATYVANGYRVAGVTQQLTQSDRGIVNITSYFLQKDTSLVRCNELIIPAPSAPKSKEAAAKDTSKDTAAKDAGKDSAKDVAKDVKKPMAPTVVMGCADVAAPGPVPFSPKPAAGFEAMLPGH
jgi:hypothetical protein